MNSITAVSLYSGQCLCGSIKYQVDNNQTRNNAPDNPIDINPGAHIYIGSKADRYDIGDELPQYDK